MQRAQPAKIAIVGIYRGWCASSKGHGFQVKSGRARHGIGGEAQPSQCVWKTRSLGNILQKPEITAIVVELRSWNGHWVERGVRRGQPKVSYTGDRGKNFI